LGLFIQPRNPSSAFTFLGFPNRNVYNNAYGNNDPWQDQQGWNEWDGLPGFGGPFPLCNNSRTKKEIFATLLLTDNYVTTVLKLDCSLKKVGSTRPLVVFYTTELSKESLLRLHSSGIQTQPIEPLKYPNHHAPRFVINWTKLRLWTMEMYSKILYLDGDMFVLQNIDHLFDLPTSFAITVDSDRNYMKKCTPMGMNQAGLFVMEPCQDVFNDMIMKLDKNETIQFQNSDAEQGFLNYYFQYVRYLLPLEYNFLADRLWNTPLRSLAKVVHYTSFKPFHPGGPLFDYHQPWLDCPIDNLSVVGPLEK